jgi:uncharacterized membrane protein YkvA (DUF1232 family)
MQMASPVQSVYTWYRNLIANPRYRWWIIGATLVYLVSPIDIAPDVIPIVGQIDDAVIVMLLVSEVGQLLTERLNAVKVRKGTVNTAANPSNAAASPVDTVDVDVVSVD